MRPLWGVPIAMVSAVVLGSCEKDAARQDFGSFVFEATERSDIPVVTAGDQTAVIHFCNLALGKDAIAAGCRNKDTALAYHKGAFRVMLLGKVNATEPLNERPDGLAALTSKPLINLEEVQQTSSPSQTGTVFAYSRLRAFGNPSLPIQTTDAGWPLVVCQNREVSRNCTLAFLMKGVFVEVRWEHFGPIHQQEIWRVAAEIDAKLRTFIRETP